jgi:phosphopentomutase
VFQIAAHEEVIPLHRLYEMCKIARRLLVGEHAVSRVIARPFVGAPGNFTRTDRRKDFSLEPIAPTVLDALKDAGLEVCAVGKIDDLYAGRGITESIHTRDDLDGVDYTITAMRRVGRGLIFTNLVDLDARYGHRNDPHGYAKNLEQIDAALAGLLDALREGDILMLTADHGNDPTTPSTDHSREYVPLLVCGPRVLAGVNLGKRETFSDVGATVAVALDVPWSGPGTSFLSSVTLASPSL